MKLKTLKDLMATCTAFPDCNYECTEIDYKELKQEAIKWYHRSDDDKHKFIREFFNITEEDLK